MPTHELADGPESETVPREVRDPVCGMMILPGDAAGSAEHSGKTYYFCNPS